MKTNKIVPLSEKVYEWKEGYLMGKDKDFYLKEDIAEALKNVEEEIDFLGIELIFTDIKDKEGNKILKSDELMELFNIFWKYLSPKVKEILKKHFGQFGEVEK